MRPDPPLPGTWRRDDGTTSFLPKGAKVDPPPGGTVKVTAPAPPAEPAKPAGPEMAPCPYCASFEYEVVEGVVSQQILDHLKAAHALLWEKLQEEVASAKERVEEEFT
jgi:hypothetical protein